MDKQADLNTQTFRQDCGVLGHLFGHEGKCLFCDLPRPSCQICAVSRQPVCWAWHRYAKAELNPIALLQRMKPDCTVGEIIEYVRAVTGITVDVHNLPERE